METTLGRRSKETKRSRPAKARGEERDEGEKKVPPVLEGGVDVGVGVVGSARI